MNVKVIEIIKFKLFRDSEQRLLKNGELDIKLIPIKGDIVFIDNIKYEVIQRDIIMGKEESVRLFVRKPY